MKKITTGLLILIFLVLACVYIFIPNNIELKAGIAVRATRPGLNRMLLDKENVRIWWPGNGRNDSLMLHNITYSIHNNNLSALPVGISGKGINISSSLYFLPILIDSTQLEWIATIPTSYNPINRIQVYLKSRTLRSDMTGILKKLEGFYKISENIYGFDIKNEFVKDSLLIVTSANNKGYPTNEAIYNLIGRLNKYANERSALQTGYPMLNITTEDSINYTIKVALPVDRPLETSGDIMQKRMLGGGNILVTEVKGGTAVINRALGQVKKYADDYERIPPAIPFCSLVTDRLKEKDSSKWITKIYFPVK